MLTQREEVMKIRVLGGGGGGEGGREGGGGGGGRGGGESLRRISGVSLFQCSLGTSV